MDFTGRKFWFVKIWSKYGRLLTLYMYINLEEFLDFGDQVFCKLVTTDAGLFKNFAKSYPLRKS